MRYVLRNRVTGDAYMVIVFTLHRVEDVNEDGTLKALPEEDIKGLEEMGRGAENERHVMSKERDEDSEVD